MERSFCIWFFGYPLRFSGYFLRKGAASWKDTILLQDIWDMLMENTSSSVLKMNTWTIWENCVMPLKECQERSPLWESVHVKPAAISSGPRLSSCTVRIAEKKPSASHLSKKSGSSISSRRSSGRKSSWEYTQLPCNSKKVWMPEQKWWWCDEYRGICWKAVHR